jgi:hypothetical protein
MLTLLMMLTGALQNGWCKHRFHVTRLIRSRSLECSFPSLQEFDKKRREAKTKAISEVLKKKDKAEKERKEIYAERRRVCVPAILSLIATVA